VAALCTSVVMMNCSVCVAWLNRLASGSGCWEVYSSACQMMFWLWLKFRSTTESSSQVPLKFRLLIYSSTRTTPDHVFHVSPLPLVWWRDLPDGVIWWTVSQMLLSQILSSQILLSSIT